RPGMVACSCDLALAFAGDLYAGSGQSMVAYVRASHLYEYRFVVLVGSFAGKCEECSVGPVGAGVYTDAYRHPWRHSDLRISTALWRSWEPAGSAAGRPDHVGGGLGALSFGRRGGSLAGLPSVRHRARRQLSRARSRRYSS